MLGVLGEWWPAVAVTLNVLLAAVVSGHIVLHKRDVRAAIGWVGLVWLAPVVGSALYGLLGINRIRRRAGLLRRRRSVAEACTRELAVAQADDPVLPAGLPPQLRTVATLVGTTTGSRVTAGNVVEPLEDGDAAYPAMLDAIAAARSTVTMATYIFDRDRAGRRFVEALGDAARRGVQVRVLVDAVGARYSRPTIVRDLRAVRVRAAEFMPSRFPLANPYFQLRNHRKVLVVDGAVAFIGGMNIREDCWLALGPAHPTRDVHFRVRGPVVTQLMEALAFDWQFTTGELLHGDAFFPAQPAAGSVVARAIPDGPDEDHETLMMTLLGVLAEAQERVRIVTPYFLPDQSLIDALRVAALRGVRVEIVLPGRGNLRLVQWAMTAQLWQVLRWGCRVFFTPPPFDHAKLMTVDGAWALIGSANWDPRSLRLNFELNVECYCPDLTRTLDRLIDARLAAAEPVTLRDVDARSLPVRLRDGVARLLQPYL